MIERNPPWLHLLEPIWQAWREDQILKGRDPDPHIEKELRAANVWPPANSPTDGASDA